MLLHHPYVIGKVLSTRHMKCLELLPPIGSISRSCHSEIVHEYVMPVQLILLPQIHAQRSEVDLGQGVVPVLEGSVHPK